MTNKLYLNTRLAFDPVVYSRRDLSRVIDGVCSGGAECSRKKSEKKKNEKCYKVR